MKDDSIFKEPPLGGYFVSSPKISNKFLSTLLYVAKMRLIGRVVPVQRTIAGLEPHSSRKSWTPSASAILIAVRISGRLLRFAVEEAS